MKNKYVAALIYLAFSWTFIPAFIGIVEGVFYFFESEENWNRRVNGIYRYQVKA